MRQNFETRLALASGAAAMHHRGPPPRWLTRAGKSRGEPIADPIDSQFLRKAVMLNLAALEAGRFAESHGNSEGLRGIARQLVGVLGRIDAECRRLAKRCAVPVAQGLDPEH